jgi:hypothetical protein
MADSMPYGLMVEFDSLHENNMFEFKLDTLPYLVYPLFIFVYDMYLHM